MSRDGAPVRAPSPRLPVPDRPRHWPLIYLHPLAAHHEDERVDKDERVNLQRPSTEEQAPGPAQAAAAMAVAHRPHECSFLRPLAAGDRQRLGGGTRAAQERADTGSRRPLAPSLLLSPCVPVGLRGMYSVEVQLSVHRYGVLEKLGPTPISDMLA